LVVYSSGPIAYSRWTYMGIYSSASHPARIWQDSAAKRKT
jgi:hypothetical protein